MWKLSMPSTLSKLQKELNHVDLKSRFFVDDLKVVTLVFNNNCTHYFSLESVLMYSNLFASNMALMCCWPNHVVLRNNVHALTLNKRTIRYHVGERKGQKSINYSSFTHAVVVESSAE